MATNFIENYQKAIINIANDSSLSINDLDLFFNDFINKFKSYINNFELIIFYKDNYYPNNEKIDNLQEFCLEKDNNLKIYITKSNEDFSEIKNYSTILLNIINSRCLSFENQALSNNYKERLKELGGIRQATILLKKYDDFYPALNQICNLLPNAFQYPQYTNIRITFNGKSFKTPNFEVNGKGIIEKFVGVGNNNGGIEVYYSKKFPDMSGGEGPFMPEEKNMISNLAVLISGAASSNSYQELKNDTNLKIRELETMYQISQIAKDSTDSNDFLGKVCNVLPKAMHYPKYASARINFENYEFVSANFDTSHKFIREQFITIDNIKGSIEIFYHKDFSLSNFHSEESLILNIFARLISGYLNEHKGREIIHKTAIISKVEKKEDSFRKTLSQNRKPLQNYFNRQMIDKYVYLDMMKFKVNHVLFVATLYDAFVLENEDSFFEKFLGDIHQFSLYTLPRITGVSTSEEAIATMENTNIDMVIIMPGMDKNASLDLSKKIREINENVPIYFLLNKNEEINYYEKIVPTTNSISKVYTWNGDSNIFFTIVKTFEDSINVENDTTIGLVRVILLIEDSPFYYSRYLEMLYTIVFGQVQRIMPEVEKNEIDKIVKMRSRPKILHAKNYEEALSIFNKYKNHLMCVLSDIEFEHGGIIDSNAGLKFMRMMRNQVYTVPVIFQSSKELRELSMDLYKEEKVFFINKNSQSLLQELKGYLMKYLGFGDFVFKNNKGEILGVAKSLREFENMLSQMPAESIYRHAVKNQFSIWLMARGEINLAKHMNTMRVTNIEDTEQVRAKILQEMNFYRTDKKKGKILNFDETSSLDEKNIITLAQGSLGGKGRGCAFIDTLIYNLENEELTKKINILAPTTVIIGTDAFKEFVSQNELLGKVFDKSISEEQLKHLFYQGTISKELKEKIRTIVHKIDKPLAIRSSSTSEDSINQPFAGVFDTYIIPNEPHCKEKTVELVCNAIKLIYASVYSEKAKNYYKVVNHKIEDEKMAVVIQEVIGSKFGNYYYPHISGVAQSYNFYPVACMLPEEGYAVTGLGLGCWVVGGRPAFRFSPRYPEIPMYNKKDLLKTTQTEFFALDCSDREINLLEGEEAALKLLTLYDAEKHGSLKHLVSVYNIDNDTIEPGLDNYGPRIVNFANILQYNYFPLAETINMILNTVKDAFGSPVEIEFAVNLNKAANGKPSFYLLQIKPLAGTYKNFSFHTSDFDKQKMLLYTNQSLGNGKIDDINDFIYIPNKKFNKMETLEMVKEIEYLNEKFANENKKYVLIGPGRWGSSDRFLGVPVEWSQITQAAVIVETSLEGFPLDFSNGSHFFHNITSMHVGYFAVQNHSKICFLHSEILDNLPTIEETPHFRHVRFEKSPMVIMDGKNKESCIVLSD